MKDYSTMQNEGPKLLPGTPSSLKNKTKNSVLIETLLIEGIFCAPGWYGNTCDAHCPKRIFPLLNYSQEN